MSWADEKIANPMGYERAVLFPRARDAIAAYAKVTQNLIGLPTNICPELIEALGQSFLLAGINQETGLAPIPVQIYGYRQRIYGELEIDPLMTGWVGRPCCASTVVSFGFKKTLNVGCGGALLTNDVDLAQALECGYWPGGDKSELTKLVIDGLKLIHRNREIGFGLIAAWDAALGDLLARVPMEQVMPWRVMRRAANIGYRDLIVHALRKVGIPVGTNYPPLTGTNKWGETVINFFPECDRATEAAEIIARILHG